MNQYYNTTYRFSCPSQSSYFSSSDYVSTSVHIVTSISIPLSVYGSYCVIKVTPKQLKNAKWALLNVHLWTVVLDIVFNVLALPFLFFPSVSGIMLGYGQYIGIPSWFLLYLIQALVSVFASAAIGLLENRQNALQTRWKINRRWVRVVINICNYMVACVTVIPPYLEKFDVQAMAMEILKTIPCPVPEFFDPRLFFVTNKPSLATMLMAIQCIILLPQGTFYALHTWYHLVYAHSSRVSAETRKMQFRFLLGSLMQILIPSTLFMNPIFYIWFSVNTGYYNQEINNHLIFIVSFHGLLGTTCMILVHKSYRNHLVRMITLGKFPRSSLVRTNPISVIVSSARLNLYYARIMSLVFSIYAAIRMVWYQTILLPKLPLRIHWKSMNFITLFFGLTGHFLWPYCTTANIIIHVYLYLLSIETSSGTAQRNSDCFADIRREEDLQTTRELTILQYIVIKVGMLGNSFQLVSIS